MNDTTTGKEIRYPWFPEIVRVVDFESSFVIRRLGMEVHYEGKATEERLKEEILNGGLEKRVRENKLY